MVAIDWASVARGALWILGLSIVLATWSYLSWRAARMHVRLRRVLSWPVGQAATCTGVVLFAAGMAWGAMHAWEKALWIVLGLLSSWQACLSFRAAARPGGSDCGA